MKLFLFDLETTGLFSALCGVHQIAGCTATVDNEGKMTFADSFNFKMKPFPGKRVYPSALEVGGLTLEQIKAYPEPIVAYKSLLSIMEKMVEKKNSEDKMFLTGYNNAKFDNDFLRQWFSDCGERFFGSYFWSNCIDTMCEATRVLCNIRPYMTDFKLGTVAKTMGLSVDKENLHDGLYDVRLTAMILRECLKNPRIRTLEGVNIGKMKEEVAAFKAEQKNKDFKEKGKEDYVIFQ